MPFFLLLFAGKVALRLPGSLSELAQSGGLRQGRQERVELERTHASGTYRLVGPSGMHPRMDDEGGLIGGSSLLPLTSAL